ncbi:hypothetical protein ACFQ6V_04825 [Streptomyces roseifaciens]
MEFEKVLPTVPVILASGGLPGSLIARREARLPVDAGQALNFGQPTVLVTIQRY